MSNILIHTDTNAEKMPKNVSNCSMYLEVALFETEDFHIGKLPHSQPFKAMYYHHL